METAVKQVLEETDHIDVLVNNAGFSSGGPKAFTLEEWKKLFDTNFFGAVRMNRAVLPSMRHRGSGLLIHISSVSGRVTVPWGGLYSASKHALEVLAETYRYELSPFGVDSILIEPWIYPTGIYSKMSAPTDKPRAAEYVAAKDVRDKIFAFFGAELKSATAGKPSELGEAIAELINKPFGKRPLHTVLPGAMGAMFQPVDSASTPIQQHLMERMGRSELLEQRGRLP